MLHRRFRDSFIINLFGTWQDVEGGRSIPVGGLAYWISPPKSISDLFLEPIHSIVYILFAMITCAFFSRFWLEISKEAPKHVAKKLADEGMTIKGYQ
jgi:protein transport protein SEC61 subunit alpha